MAQDTELADRLLDDLYRVERGVEELFGIPDLTDRDDPGLWMRLPLRDLVAESCPGQDGHNR